MDSRTQRQRLQRKVSVVTDASLNNEELTFKIVLVGASKAGKTSIVRRLLDKSFREEYVATVAFEVSYFLYGSYANTSILLELWDVSGEQLTAIPNHHALIGMGTAGVIFVLDSSSTASLQAVDQWNAALSPYLPINVIRILAAHKFDLPRCVIEKSAMDAFINAAGFSDWCCTVGGAQYGDYSVGGIDDRRRALAAKQLSVQELIKKLVDGMIRMQNTSKDKDSSLPEPALESLLNEDHALDKYLLNAQEVDTNKSFPVVKPNKLKENKKSIQFEEDIPSTDKGWKSYAGSIDREKADELLKGQPQGSYLLRRKSPKQLVLCIVMEPGQPVQHVLINYEQGHFGDQQGRIGKFPSLEEFLHSKISKLATTPMYFRRVKGSCKYVQVDSNAFRTFKNINTNIPGMNEEPINAWEISEKTANESVDESRTVVQSSYQVDKLAGSLREMTNDIETKLEDVRLRCPQCDPVLMLLQSMIRLQHSQILNAIQNYEAKLETSKAVSLTKEGCSSHAQQACLLDSNEIGISWLKMLESIENEPPNIPNSPNVLDKGNADGTDSVESLRQKIDEFRKTLDDVCLQLSKCW